MDKQKLEEKKIALVWELNKIQQKISEYWLLDVAYDDWPFKYLKLRKMEIEFDIKKIKKILDNN